jgi:hypothetical protein
MGKAECALCRSRRHCARTWLCCARSRPSRSTYVAFISSAVRHVVSLTDALAATGRQTKSPLLEADRRLDERMQRVEALTDRVMKARERLCSGEWSRHQQSPQWKEE